MRLYAVLLGGSGSPGRLTEDHETVFVVAEDDKAAKQQAKARWSGHGRCHVDALQPLELVDGHRIELVPAEGEAAAATSFNDDPHDED